MYDTVVLERDAAVTRSGQLSFPRAIAEHLGVSFGKDRVSLAIRNDGTVTISKQPSFMEQLEAAHAHLSPEQRSNIQRDAKKATSELIDEWAASPEGQKDLEARYDI